MLSAETKSEIAQHIPGASRATGRLEKFGYDANSKAIFEIVEALLDDAYTKGYVAGCREYEPDYTPPED